MTKRSQTSTKPGPPTTLFATLIAFAMVTSPAAHAIGIALPDPVSVTWEQTDKITPDDSDDPALYGFPSHSGVRFGSSVVSDGDTLAVGTAPVHVSQTSAECHCTDWVYIFERVSGGEWVQKAKLENGEDSGFGFSLDLDEESGVLVVGDPGYPRENDDRPGNAYIYERTQDGDWVLAKDVLHDREPGVDYGSTLGNSVTVDRETVVVSVTGEETEAGPITGAVYVFERGSEGEWERTARITPENPVEGMAFGSIDEGLALEDGRLVAAAWSEQREEIDLIEAGDVPNRGAVYIFEHEGEDWVQAARLTVPDDEQSWCFGYNTALSGDRVLVGDRCRPSSVDQAAPWGPPFVAYEGQAYVFERDGQDWELAATLTGSMRATDEMFAHSGDIEGDRVVIGAPNYPHVSIATGTAYVYDRVGEEWMNIAMLRSNETLTGDRFGFSVDAGEDGRIFVGAIWDHNRGDDWPYPFDDTNIAAIQETDGWTAGSLYEFSVEPVSAHVAASISR